MEQKQFLTCTDHAIKGKQAMTAIDKILATLFPAFKRKFEQLSYIDFPS